MDYDGQQHLTTVIVYETSIVFRYLSQHLPFLGIQANGPGRDPNWRYHRFPYQYDVTGTPRRQALFIPAEARKRSIAEVTRTSQPPPAKQPESAENAYKQDLQVLSETEPNNTTDLTVHKEDLRKTLATAAAEMTKACKIVADLHETVRNSEDELRSHTVGAEQDLCALKAKHQSEVDVLKERAVTAEEKVKELEQQLKTRDEQLKMRDEELAGARRETSQANRRILKMGMERMGVINTAKHAEAKKRKATDDGAAFGVQGIAKKTKDAEPPPPPKKKKVAGDGTALVGPLIVKKTRSGQ